MNWKIYLKSIFKKFLFIFSKREIARLMVKERIIWCKSSSSFVCLYSVDKICSFQQQYLRLFPSRIKWWEIVTVPMVCYPSIWTYWAVPWNFKTIQIYFSNFCSIFSSPDWCEMQIFCFCYRYTINLNVPIVKWKYLCTCWSSSSAKIRWLQKSYNRRIF